ncbi:class II aaRS and biotin synthetase [Microthyrium microscopicum]|uniref:threonine--tRNA ligase n=1 Tax=Microthyrium microscopicum TaxID=703497 RepID=A0A6A6TZP5_9PEZI|nr:class II aaRS and biotin synthetase [Microthyrium microscopicum]
MEIVYIRGREAAFELQAGVTCSCDYNTSADHRELAHSQQLLTGSIYSPGSPLFLPNGADMMNKLTACLRAHYPLFGFREVITPNIYKRSLWEKSGHWDNYANDMFEVRGRGATGVKENADIGEDEVFGLKPMNCPGHCLLFASQNHSYRDLPIRYADFSSLHRNEISGALTGLTRVRRFHQDDGHIFCRPDQIEAEIKKTMDFIDLVYGDIFGMREYRLVLSTRPAEKYIGSVEDWDRAERQLKSALDSSERDWTLNEGDGAFYGPKIDIILKDAHGKEHQTATVQLDFQLPQRFELKYDAPGKDGEDLSRETPVLIHRAVLGSLERFLALIIEHYNGRYPFWISPRPLKILSVSQKPEELQHIENVAAELAGVQAGKARKIPSRRPNIQVEIDTSARPLGKKIREAKNEGFNFIIVIGPQDAEKGGLVLRMLNQWDEARSLEILGLTLGPDGLAKDPKNIRTNARDVRAFLEKLQDEYM